MNQNNENYLKEVREQYENYPYPPVNPEDEKHRIHIPILEAFDRLNHFCFSGKRDLNKNFRTLVAGGGTGDAAIALAEQLRDTEAEVVYIDMSEASMKVAKERAAKRGLTNIQWVRDSLLNIPQLGLGKFDYINSSGVLHHLADPDLGLRILADALNEDGAMGLMLYAKYGRTAVYQMQDMLRILNQNEPNLQKRVDNAKGILNNLPLTNWFLASPIAMRAEVQSDNGIYDLLLHSQDRSYSVPELYDYARKAGLQILQLFSDDFYVGNNLYNPLYYLKDENLIQIAAQLPLEEQQALAELLNGKIFKHTFYVAKTPRVVPDPENLENIPLLGFDIYNETNNICHVIHHSNDLVVLKQTSNGATITLQKTPHLEEIFRAIDGKLSLKEIFRKIMDAPANKNNKPNYQTLLHEFLPMYYHFNLHNWLFLRAPGSSYVIQPDVLQGRVK